MSVKIIIKRKYKEAPGPLDFQVINKIRKIALQQKGYVSGETLVNIEDNSVLVLSTWTRLADWEAWAKSDERAELEYELTPFLKEPLKIKSYKTSAAYIQERTLKIYP
jgi:heme-degrading monooxygenase HmoA